MIPFWLDVVIKLIPAFITLIVGGFGSWIAFSQYQTNRDKLRLDLFEKRLEAYEDLQKYFRYFVREANVDQKALALLFKARYKSMFLFDQDIADYIENVLKRAKEMRIIMIKLHGENSLPIGGEREQLAQREAELLTWNLEQLEDSPKRYSKYLKFK